MFVDEKPTYKHMPECKYTFLSHPEKVSLIYFLLLHQFFSPAYRTHLCKKSFGLTLVLFGNDTPYLQQLLPEKEQKIYWEMIRFFADKSQ